jgi:hypothetical protein
MKNLKRLITKKVLSSEVAITTIVLFQVLQITILAILLGWSISVNEKITTVELTSMIVIVITASLLIVGNFIIAKLSNVRRIVIVLMLQIPLNAVIILYQAYVIFVERR